MFFEQIPVGTMKNFCYLVGDNQEKICACIDPGWEVEKILATAKKSDMNITMILLTHVHYDHSGSAEELESITNAKVFASHAIPEWKKTHPKFCVPEKTNGLSEQSTIFIGNTPIEILETPGHQSDHLAFIIGKYLFTGDTLFVDTIGRTDLEDSDEIAMKKSLKKLANLNEHLLICSGHDYGSVPIRTLGEEKRQNPFLLSL
jgi:hydroxyacylglutathione hydrolase